MMQVILKKIIRITVLMILVMTSLFVFAEGQDEKYLLSSESYTVLTEARELMDKKEYTAAETRLNNLLNTNQPDYDKAVTYQTLGYIYISINRFDNATTAFINSVRNNALPPDVMHEINYTIAQLLAQAGKYSESMEYLIRWFEKEKSPSAEAHLFMASVYYQLEKYRKMIPHIQETINRSSKPERQWYEMLLAGYYQLNELNNAAKLLEKMVKIYPDSSNYWLQLAGTYYQVKNYKKALAVYRLAYTKGILDEEEIVRLARLYLNEQLPYQAGKLLDETMKAGKIRNSTDNLKLLANSWLLARENDLAISALLKLSEIDNNPNTHLRLGQIYFEQEKWKDAVAMLERAVKNESQLENTGEAYLLLGIAAYHVDDNNRSANALKKAVGYKTTKQQAEWWLNKLDDKDGEKKS